MHSISSITLVESTLNTTIKNSFTTKFSTMLIENITSLANDLLFVSSNVHDTTSRTKSFSNLFFSIPAVNSRIKFSVRNVSISHINKSTTIRSSQLYHFRSSIKFNSSYFSFHATFNSFVNSFAFNTQMFHSKFLVVKLSKLNFIYRQLLFIYKFSSTSRKLIYNITSASTNKPFSFATIEITNHIIKINFISMRSTKKRSYTVIKSIRRNRGIAIRLSFSTAFNIDITFGIRVRTKSFLLLTNKRRVKNVSNSISFWSIVRHTATKSTSTSHSITEVFFILGMAANPTSKEQNSFRVKLSFVISILAKRVMIVTSVLFSILLHFTRSYTMPVVTNKITLSSLFFTNKIIETIRFVLEAIKIVLVLNERFNYTILNIIVNIRKMSRLNIVNRVNSRSRQISNFFHVNEFVFLIFIEFDFSISKSNVFFSSFSQSFRIGLRILNNLL